MGFSLSWLAVRGIPTEVAFNQLGVRGTGIHEAFPMSSIVSANLPGGWSLVIADKNERFVSDTILQPLSSNCEVVACFIEEHVMFSMSTGWKDGHKIWSISHNAQQGIEHLEVQGDLPPMVNSIRDRLYSEQQAAGGKEADVDFIFDVPIELARALTGYIHDKDISGAGDSPFEVLEDIS